MTTSGIIILVIFIVLNLMGASGYLYTTRYNEKNTKYWLKFGWTIICGITYLPLVIYDLIKNKGISQN